MSRRFRLEEQAARALNTEKADHLAEAIADLATLIARLESEASSLAPSEQSPP